MKRATKLLAMLLAVVLVMSFALTACTETGDNGTTTNPGSSTTKPTDPKPTDPKPTDPNTPTNPGNPDDPTDPTEPEVPVGDLQIVVVPDVMEIYAGEEIDLMFGVVANEGARVIILDDDDFDNETPGTYEITYQATLGDKKVTGTRTITVLEALSNIALEVRNNNLGENKWKGVLLNFAHKLYVQLTQDTELTKQSGVFHNTSDKEIVLTVAGTHGCAAILDKNGVVIEGRDGANSKLVNAKNPTRAGSSATTITIDGESVTVSSAFAKQLKIPAGGYAIIVQSSYAGTTADTDGRGFMNYNVIYEIGNVVRLYWVDSNETLTPYINQKPTVSGNNKMLVQLGDDTFVLETAVLAGIIAKDDNGTFALKDDITLEDIKIVSNGNFDVNKAGVYTVKLSVSDGKLTTEFTREIEVKSEGVGTLQIGENKMNVGLDFVAKDKDLSGIGNNVFLIYTSKYNGGLPANGYGVAIVVNKYGQIVRIYDGANGKYYDAKNTSGVVDSAKCDPKTYLNQAIDSLQNGELAIIAPNSTANNAEGGSRKFLLSNRTIGATVSGLGLTFESASEGEDPCKDGHSYVNGVCGNCGAEDPNYDPCAGGHNFVEGECTRCGEADPDYVAPPVNPDDLTINIGNNSMNIAPEKVAVDQELTAVGDYAFIIYTSDYTGEIGFTNGYGVAIVVNKYGKIVRIYDGASAKFFDKDHNGVTNAGCTANGYAKEALASLQEGEIAIIAPHTTVNSGDGGSRKFFYSNRTVGATVSGLNLEFVADPCADGHNFVDGKCADCGEADPDFDPCADGHNFVDGKCADCGEADPNFDPCADGHSFKDGKCEDCGEADPDYVAPTDNKTITIAGKEFTSVEGKWAYNDATVVAGTAANYSMIIYDGKYEGTVALNGYGAALVLNKYGELVKIYDGANVGFWTKDGKAASAGFTASNYATVAFEALEEGEILIVFPNGGDNAHRAWALGLRNAPNGPSECGQIATLTGFTFEVKPSDDKTITVGDKTFTAVEGKWAYNDESVVAANVAGYKMVIYDKSYTGAVSLNGYGAAIVLDKYGTLVKIYDAANMGFWTAEGKSTAVLTYTASNYATVAFSELADGEILIVFPNDGANAADSARVFALSLRNVGGEPYCGKTATLTGFEFEVKPSDDKTITIGTKAPFTAVEGKWAYNDATITAANAASYSMIIYDGKYEGAVALNGYGAAIVLNKYGELVKIYDGANVGFWTKDGKAASAGFTASNYATVAFEALEEGEMLIVFPNDGASNAARGWALGLRNAPNGPSECGKVVTLTGFAFEEVPSKDKTLTIGDKSFTAVEGKWAYNDSTITAANAANYGMIIYDGNYEGEVALNGYGAAIVLDQYGTLVKIYDAANMGFWTAEGKSTAALTYTAANYATVAFSELAEGEILIVFANDGGANGNAARGWALGLRNVGGEPYCGKTATLTGFTFETK